MKNSFKLEEIECYKTSSKLSDYIYPIVKRWSFLDQKTIGLQAIRSIDSIGANIAEGFGRYHKKDKIKFFYNARASAFESAHWITRAYERKLLTHTDFKTIISLLQQLPKQINYLIKMTQNNLER